MIEGAQFLAFVGLVLLGSISPGPDFIMAARHALGGGVRSGMLCALGIGAGVLVWAMVVA